VFPDINKPSTPITSNNWNYTYTATKTCYVKVSLSLNMAAVGRGYFSFNKNGQQVFFTETYAPAANARISGMIMLDVVAGDTITTGSSSNIDTVNSVSWNLTEYPPKAVVGPAEAPAMSPALADFTNRGAGPWTATELCWVKIDTGTSTYMAVRKAGDSDGPNVVKGAFVLVDVGTVISVGGGTGNIYTSKVTPALLPPPNIDSTWRKTGRTIGGTPEWVKHIEGSLNITTPNTNVFYVISTDIIPALKARIDGQYYQATIGANIGGALIGSPFVTSASGMATKGRLGLMNNGVDPLRLYGAAEAASVFTFAGEVYVISTTQPA
jgi:hypothetical protein